MLVILPLIAIHNSNIYR